MGLFINNIIEYLSYKRSHNKKFRAIQILKSLFLLLNVTVLGDAKKAYLEIIIFAHFN